MDFHEVGFGATLNGENGQPFWFQMSDQQRQKAGSPWGPNNPQALNRYSYVLNGPMKATDPKGHWRTVIPVAQLDVYKDELSRYQNAIVAGITLAGVAAAAICSAATAGTATIICGAYVAGTAGVLIAHVVDDYAELNSYLDRAKVAAGDNGSIAVETRNRTVLISAYDADGKLKAQYIYNNNAPSYIIEGLEFAAKQTGLPIERPAPGLPSKCWNGAAPPYCGGGHP